MTMRLTVVNESCSSGILRSAHQTFAKEFHLQVCNHFIGLHDKLESTCLKFVVDWCSREMYHICQHGDLIECKLLCPVSICSFTWSTI